MRYVFILGILLVISLPVSPQEVDLADQLETILNLYETGLTKIELGLTQLEAGQIQLDQAQTILEKQQSALEKSFQIYVKNSDTRYRFLTYAFWGVTVILAVETIAFAVLIAPLSLKQ